MEVDQEPAQQTDATAPKAGKDGKSGTLIESTKLAQKWQQELDASKKWMERFTREARDCERAYTAEGQGELQTARRGKVNLFWSNVQVVLAAIYGRLPKASVERRYKDQEDDVSRVAGIMLQRILNNDLDRQYDDTAAAMRDATQDRFVVGLGQVWLRYDVDTEQTEQPQIDPMTGMPALDEQGAPIMEQTERIVNEEADTDYVYWDDFRYAPCRRWRECRWVARRITMSEERLAKRFKLSPQQVAMVPKMAREPNPGNANQDVLRATPFTQAAVWEIWDRDSNQVCWYVEGCTFVLDYQTDPLELEDFFPCPQPVVGTTPTKAFIPHADYILARDLYEQLDKLNTRISRLTDAIKVVGARDKTAGALEQMLSPGFENNLVPIENWSHFVERGGLSGVVDWMPIEQYVNAIMQLSQRKKDLQRDLYEVLGISDIMRGATMASETATAQTLKVQYGGARLTHLQNDVARFVSDVMRIRANIICNVWQPETIIARSQIMQTPDAPLAQQAVQKLKDFGTALYSITVTSDALAAPDWAAEKEARTEFLGATSNYLMAAGPMVQQSPAVGSFLMKLLQWAAAGFRGAQTIEGVLDQAARQLEQQAAEPPAPQPPSPEDKKTEAQAAKYGAEAERTARETALMPQPPMGPPMGPPGPQMPGPMNGLAMQPQPPQPM